MRHLSGNISSISARLKLMNIFVSGIALLLAFASFLAYDMVAFQRDLVHTLHTETQIIGANMVSALMFEDQEAATTTLSALRGSPEVISAVVLDKGGDPFAKYVSPGGADILNVGSLQPGRRDVHWSKGNHLMYGSRIVFKGEQVGTIYILAQTEALSQRSLHYALIAALVLAFCMIIALLLTSTFRNLLTEPLIDLAQTAQIVRDKKDYSVRARVSGKADELALLVRSFNEMLDDIQERDKALEQSRTALEERVQQRTAELSAANKELEAFSYTVAHDLRGPLEIIGNLGFLLKESHGDQLDANAQHFLDELINTTRMMSSLIQDLLNLSRASRTDFHREIVNLSKMASDILESRQEAEPERQVQTKVIEGAIVLADEGLLCVVMENLLGNAWKYTSKQKSPRIEFGSTDSNDETIFFVRDNGAGFDPAYADRLFQPFQRLHVHSEFPGTGIGLATVYRIITRHGGRIWAQGSVGSGATFFFTLPYKQNPQNQ